MKQGNYFRPLLKIMSIILLNVLLSSQTTAWALFLSNTKMVVSGKDTQFSSVMLVDNSKLYIEKGGSLTVLPRYPLFVEKSKLFVSGKNSRLIGVDANIKTGSELKIGGGAKAEFKEILYVSSNSNIVVNPSESIFPGPVRNSSEFTDTNDVTLLTSKIIYLDESRLEVYDGGRAEFSEAIHIDNDSTAMVTGKNSLITASNISIGKNSIFILEKEGELEFEKLFVDSGGLLNVQKEGIFKLNKNNFLSVDKDSFAQFSDHQSLDGTVYLSGIMTGSELLFTESSHLLYEDGSVINGDLTMNGTLAYLNSDYNCYGNLTVNGNYTHEEDGVYITSIDLKNLTSNHLQVNGHLKINGGTVLALWDGHVRTDTTIHIMDSDTTEGLFDTIEGSTALVKIEINDQSVIFTRKDYVFALGQNNSYNLSSITSALDEVSLNVRKDTDMYDILSLLDHMMTNEQLQDAYAQMTPSIISAYPDIVSETDRYAQNVARQRISDQLPDNNYNIYIVPFGGISKIFKNSLGDYTGHKANTTGFIIGTDRLYDHGWIAGINSSVHKTTIDWTDTGVSSGEMMIFTGNVLTGYVNDVWDIALNAGFGFYQSDTDRRIVFSESTYLYDVNRIAESSLDGVFWSTGISGGYNIPVKQSYILRPEVSLRYIRTEQNECVDHNANDLNLTVGGTKIDNIESSIGLSLSGGLLFHNCIELDYRISASWLHHFINRPVVLLSELQNNGNFFITEWNITDRDRISVDTNLKLSVTDNLSTSVNYEYVQGDTFSSHTGHLSINYNF